MAPGVRPTQAHPFIVEGRSIYLKIAHYIGAISQQKFSLNGVHCPRL